MPAAKIMIDCGMEQGENVYENVELPVSPNDIDAMLLTHAHIDHSGHIPYVSANGFSAPIYTTSATDRLCRIMLMDSAHIQEFEAEWKNRKTSEAVKNRLSRFIPRKTYKMHSNILLRANMTRATKFLTE